MHAALASADAPATCIVRSPYNERVLARCSFDRNTVSLDFAFPRVGGPDVQVAQILLVVEDRS